MLLSRFVNLVEQDSFLSRSFTTRSNYRSTLQSVLSYSGCEVSLSLIFTHDWLSGYQGYLLKRGISRNTVAFYMSILRALYNRALHLGYICAVADLFTDIITTSEETVKRSLPADVIYRIASSDFPSSCHLEFSREMFLLSFYLQGMPYVDLAYLRKNDLRGDGILQYRRHKTNVEIIVGVHKEAMRLIRKYQNHSASSPYLLSILHPSGEDFCGSMEEARQYRNSLRNYNRHLKQIASMLNIHEDLSSYVARHTWATLAYHNKVDMRIISQALGHRKEEMTHTYVRLLDPESFIKANRIVYKAVFGKSKLIQRRCHTESSQHRS